MPEDISRVNKADGPDRSPVDRAELAERLRSVTDLLGAIALDPSVLEVLTEKERIQLVSAAGDVFEPDVELRRRRVRARQRRERAEKLRRDEDVLAGAE